MLKLLIYSIYELPANKKICSGTRTYSSADIVTTHKKGSNEEIIQKYLELEQGYKIGASLFQSKELIGFGLKAKKNDSDFSWEWYDKKQGNIFVKRQGETLVKIKVNGLPMLETLASVEFLDDTKLGFILNAQGTADTHYILISKGSVLNFSP